MWYSQVFDSSVPAFWIWEENPPAFGSGTVRIWSLLTVFA